ncbi:MAG: hypothetical protein AB8B52_00475 [Winogradskyella sp.]|uniref:hypothetical protein n=1 Tax=Winogradskyella sp. TaxID=1883156 RepID=UPI00385AD745
MKKTATLAIALLMFLTSIAQEKAIETESVTLDNLITFIVEHYSVEADSTKTKHLTFLIETYDDDFNTEDGVILKQAFKLLSKRVTENDVITMVTYNYLNGIALNKAKATEVKKLLYAIEHPKMSMTKLEDDGISVAYKYAEEHYIEGAENAVVMIRLPNRKVDVSRATVNTAKNTNSNKGNAVVLSAIALLPELIAIIKD